MLKESDELAQYMELTGSVEWMKTMRATSYVADWQWQAVWCSIGAMNWTKLSGINKQYGVKREQ